MPRNRMIKSDFWADEKIGSVSRDARLLFQGTWTFADDGGVCRAHPVYLRNNIFPYDDDMTIGIIEKLLNELSLRGLVTLYECKGEKYLNILNFSKHQQIQHPSLFRYPRLNEDSMSAHEDYTPKEKGKGKERAKGARSFSDVVDIEGDPFDV